MPQITDIKPQKRKTSEPRFNIYLDGKFGFALPSETLVKEGLKIDQELSQKEIDELVKENEYLRVYDRVLNFISFRPRSEKEIKDFFKRKEVGEETQKMIWEKLKHLGYINDEEFVEWWVEQRQTYRQSGFRKIAMELRQKGISRELVESIKYKAESKDELDLAKKAAEKKARLYKNLPPLEFKQKMSSFLARRGFSWEIIEEVIKIRSENDDLND